VGTSPSPSAQAALLGRCRVSRHPRPLEANAMMKRFPPYTFGTDFLLLFEPAIDLSTRYRRRLQAHVASRLCQCHSLRAQRSNAVRNGTKSMIEIPRKPPTRHRVLTCGRGTWQSGPVTRHLCRRAPRRPRVALWSLGDSPARWKCENDG
jgi:hypothetical protein